MAFIVPLLLAAGKSFGAGAMSELGCYVASSLFPIVAAKVFGAVKQHPKETEHEYADTYLC